MIAIDTAPMSIYEICNYIGKKHGWHMSSLHLPKSAHICITPSNVENFRKNFCKNVKEAMKELTKNPPKQCDLAAMYGATSQLPSK